MEMLLFLEEREGLLVGIWILAGLAPLSANYTTSFSLPTIFTSQFA